MTFETDYKKKYWDSLMKIFNNEYGVAGLMGNLQAESGLLPYRKQGDMTPPYIASQNYTNGVDSGSISKDTFVNDSVGYGVAQWTWHTRKEKLYDMHEESGLSIGSFELSIDMLKYELTLTGGYKSVGDFLKTAASVRSASDKVLHDYENPKDQSVSVEIARYELASQIYAQFSGTEPDQPDNPTSGRKMPLWMYII